MLVDKILESSCQDPFIAK